MEVSDKGSGGAFQSDTERDVAPTRSAQAGALLTLAAAVKCAPASSAAAKALADLVLREAAEDLCDGPGEYETTAMTFNRQMDTVLDAANASARFAMRVTRRTHMARALERAGLVMVDAGQLAKLIEVRVDDIERAAGHQPSQPSPAATGHPPLACAADMEAAGGEHHARPFDREFNELSDSEAHAVETCGDFIGDVGRDPMPNYGVND